ncbi:MAG: hypothetical protein ABW199_10670 [Caulobacterales bacterium]
MRCILLAVALSVLAACATKTAAEDEDPFHLHISIGRWSAMVSQIADIHAIAQPDHVSDDELLEASVLSRNLRMTVWQYNLERAQLCAERKLIEASCGAPYQPGWLIEARAAPSYRELAIRSRDVGDRVMPFWNAVCADAKAREPDPEMRQQICPME